MKRKVISRLFLAMCAIAMVSCQKEENDPNTKEFKTFSASVEQSDAKTAINIVGNDTLIYWSTGDQISVLSTTFGWGATYTENNNNLPSSNINGIRATFSGDVTTGSNGRHIALYPYDSQAECKDRALTGIQTILPSSQTAVAGSFDPKANIMVASAANDETIFHFKNACAYLKIHSPYSCSSIQIISNGTRMISGIFKVDVATDGTPQTSLLFTS